MNEEGNERTNDRISTINRFSRNNNNVAFCCCY